ncbi:gamma-glutamyltransferase [Paenibacillaceae bacterium]|nr:gamma-glutamyltransferase [Paenibacillaceae bacterium]
MNRSIIGTKAMVVSPHYLATAAGARILEQGGNAFDAAVAVSAALAVVYPHMTGLGGDSFWLMHHPADGRMRAYNGSGRSGYLAGRSAFAGAAAIPVRGAKSAITVPGMVDNWAAVLGEYGKLTLADVLSPAIDYAANGFPVSADQCVHTAEQSAVLAEQPAAKQIFMPDGRLPQPGQRFRQRQLAGSLSELARVGRSAFYEGELSRSITSDLRSQGGLLTMEDFADHTGEWVEPISTDYRGYQVYQLPPNSQGFTGLMALNIIENFNLQQLEHGSYAYYHLLVEALKLSFRDRNKVLTDPDFNKIPLARLLGKSYARELAAQIDWRSACSMETVKMGNDTAYAAVVDKDGNAVSFIQSLYFEFGSAVAAGDTGILLQNRGSFFSLDPGHVNCLEPHKRTFHTLMPAMACRDGKPSILYGTQGGEGQPQTQTALLTRMIDFDMDPQAAVDAPRWLWGRTWGEANQALKLEGRIDADVAQALASAGHDVQVVSDFNGLMGHAHAIRIDPDTGFLSGGADPRSDGVAIGW